MSLTDAIILKFLCGKPVICNNICTVRSPFLREIAAEGLDRFYSYISFMTIQKPSTQEEEVRKLLSPLSDFEYLILLSQMEESNYKFISAAFKFFTDEDVTIISSPPQIIFGPPEEKRIMTQNDFPYFQELISVACALKSSEANDIELLESDSPQVRALKEQMLRGRKQRAAAKKKAAVKSGEKEIEMSDLIGSLTIGSNSYNLVNVWDITYYALQDQLKRMSWREEFNINTRASLAGAKLDKKKLSHWIKTMSFN